MYLRYLTLVTLAFQWAFPFARMLIEAAKDGRVERDEVIAVLQHVWPVEADGTLWHFKLPFYRGD